MLYEFCHFATMNMALGFTIPLEILTTFTLFLLQILQMGVLLGI